MENKSLPEWRTVENSGEHKSLPEWRTYRLAPNVYRFPNQTFYGEIVGSYLIEQKDFVILVDGPQELTEEHEDFVSHFGKKNSSIYDSWTDRRSWWNITKEI